MKILLVDDDDLVRETIAGMLDLPGYDVTQSCNGEDALEKLGQDEFDIVITDMVMPKKGGAQLIEAIKASNNPVPILAISGKIPVKEREDLNTATCRADYVLNKPFEGDDLAETIGNILSGSANSKKSRKMSRRQTI